MYLTHFNNQTVEWKDFPYSASWDFRLNLTIHEPTLKAKLRSGSQMMPTQMLVDSGAQDTLIHADFAPALGIDISKCPTQRVGGITGAREGYVHSVLIEFPGLSDSITVNAIFVPDMGINGLLGQLDFFSAYYVRFDRPNLKFSLKKVPQLSFT